MKRFPSIKKNSDFQNIYRNGKSYANRLLVMYVMRNGEESNQLGISVSKKVGNSVVRHHIARLMREIFRLMLFDGIVRNRLKIASTITNARCFIAIQKEFGSFYNYTLSFFPEQKPIVNNFKSLKEIPITTPESDAMSKDMKKRGFKFFGSTICYAHMQATGFVNDHLEGCFCREKIFTDCSV